MDVTWLTKAFAAGALLALGLLWPARSVGAVEATPETSWCAPELETIAEGTCFWRPTRREHVPVSTEAAGAAMPATGTANSPDRGSTLVLFLHSLVGEGSGFQWEQQRAMARIAARYGMYALMPRGRKGIGPGRDPRVYAWPTSMALQAEHEAAIFAEWSQALSRLQASEGRFGRLLVFGFSNGAYYAASLALRGKLAADGYGLFAGGSGSRYLALAGKQAQRRVPIFVGWGTKDPDRRNQQALARLLGELGWPHRVRSERIGHTVGNRQLEAAMTYLLAQPPLDRSATPGTGLL